MDREIQTKLEKRLGRVHAGQRLGIEQDHEARIFGHGLNFFHLENFYSVHALIRNTLKLTGLYRRGLKNAAQLEIRHHDIESAHIPPSFDGFTLLHISDLHVDMNQDAMRRLKALTQELAYDVCVLTGDYRGKTHGTFEETLEGLAALVADLQQPIYGVLGNHDTIRMVPGLEDMGVRMLLNESVTIEKKGERIYLAGIDDAHYYRVDNIERAVRDIARDDFTILLSHTPEIYRHAAHADIDLLLAGHTHGGQICLPGSVPVFLDSVLPRRMGSGPWTYHDMFGYTSVGAGSSIVPVRLNCPPEITLHHLRSI